MARSRSISASVVTAPSGRRLARRFRVSTARIVTQAGYIEIGRGFVGKRPRTSARLTPAGRAAFEQHVAALQEMVAGSGVTIVPR